MTNKPKSKGTAFESAVVNYLHAHGSPDARRVALTGAKDRGDIHVGDWVIEAKAYADVRAAIRAALRQGPIEAGHAGKARWAGVVKSPNANIAEAWVVVPLYVFAQWIALYDDDAVCVHSETLTAFPGVTGPHNGPSVGFGALSDDEARRTLQ